MVAEDDNSGGGVGMVVEVKRIKRCHRSETLWNARRERWLVPWSMSTDRA